MQLWDDLLRERAEVIVLGATNRPQDLDPAVQRRFERALLVPSPDLNARRQVLTRILRHTRLDADFDAYKCAQATEGYTSSDLSSVCKAAVRLARKEQQPGGSIRPLRTEVGVTCLHVLSWCSDCSSKLQFMPSFCVVS